MAEYISRDDALLHSEIIEVYTKDYGNIDVVPVEYLADIPSVDVQPARFARWIDLDNRILCSGCGAGYDDSDEVKQNTYIFCPNCGARMDGEHE